MTVNITEKNGRVQLKKHYLKIILETLPHRVKIRLSGFKNATEKSNIRAEHYWVGPYFSNTRVRGAEAA